MRAGREVPADERARWPVGDAADGGLRVSAATRSFLKLNLWHLAGEERQVSDGVLLRGHAPSGEVLTAADKLPGETKRHYVGTLKAE